MSMGLLNESRYKPAAMIFRRIMKTLENRPTLQALRILTMNNLSCCYKRWGKLDKAKICLERLEGEEGTQHSALTDLNLCAVYSELKDHEKSIRFA